MPARAMPTWAMTASLPKSLDADLKNSLKLVVCADEIRGYGKDTRNVANLLKGRLVNCIE